MMAGAARLAVAIALTFDLMRESRHIAFDDFHETESHTLRRAVSQ